MGKTAVAIQAPSVVGQTVADANKTLTAVKLQLGLQTPQNDPSAPIGTILSQVPAAGTSIKEGESINVTVSSGAAKTTVPNLVGLVGPDAINKALGDAHLKLGRYPQQDSDTVPAPSPNTVLSQSPSPNSQVDANTTVDIVISSGRIKVPAVLNESKTQANNDLVNAGFNVTVIYEDHSDKPDGIVLAQTPAGGAGLAQGSYVTITVSRFVSASPTPSNTGVPSPLPTKAHSKTPVPTPSAS